MTEFRQIKNSDLPLIAQASTDWFGLEDLQPNARFQLFELGLFSKPSFEFKNCWAAIADGEIIALTLCTTNTTEHSIIYANCAKDNIPTLTDLLRHVLAIMRKDGQPVRIGCADTGSPMSCVPGIIENNGARGTFVPVIDLLKELSFSQFASIPLLALDTTNHRPPFSREQMELRRTHSIGTKDDVDLEDWQDNLANSHLTTVELIQQNRQTGQADATILLTAIPDGQPAQTNVALKSCDGEEPYLSSLLSDICRGHQGTLTAALASHSLMLEHIGFEIVDHFTMWK